MKILLITPPLTQINTPYPATPYIKGFLKSRGFEVVQADLGIELILRIFSKKGFQRLFEVINQVDFDSLSENSQRMITLQNEYLSTINIVIRFLQNKDTTLAHRICNDGFLTSSQSF